MPCSGITTRKPCSDFDWFNGCPNICIISAFFFFLLEVARLFNLFIIHIRCRDPWKAFAEKGGYTTVVKRKCKIVKNSKEQVQFTTLWKALQKWYKEKRKKEGIFREE